MPLYEYKCRKCNAHTEVIQKVSDKPLTKCRKCGGRLEKLLSAPAIQFKGTGWYITDYAGKKAEKSEGKEERGATSETKTSTDKATSKDTTSSKKATKPASSSND